MVRKGKKSRSFYQWGVFCLTAIAALSFLGVGYASWDGNLKLFQSISSGNIDPYFSNYELDPTNNEQEGLQIIREEDVITITGKVQPGYQGILSYEVTNRGTVPVKCSLIDGDQNLPEGITIQGPERIIRGKNGFGKGKLNIYAGQEGNYEFEAKLTIHQWNAMAADE